MMGLFSKYHGVEPTLYDEKRKDLHIELLEKQSWLEKCTKRVIVKNGVINLYPEGADKEAAKNESEKAKKTLLAAIGSYDGIRIDILRYIKEHTDSFVTTTEWPLDYITSHEIIERTYARFFQETH